MTNLEVARYLLEKFIALGRSFMGVVFLNDADERMVLMRDGFRVVELRSSGLSMQQRFSFYDHVHTTGMDIKQPLSCTAFLTLSKDMSFRDYAQGAYRMRGIGKGQKIHLFVPSEVESLIIDARVKIENSADRNAANAERQRIEGLGKNTLSPAWNQAMIVQSTVWLLLNGLKMEEKKYRLLCWQNLQNIWGEDANGQLDRLQESDKERKSEKERIEEWCSVKDSAYAIDNLKHWLEFDVSTALPGHGGETLVQKIENDVKRVKDSAKESGLPGKWDFAENKIKKIIDALQSSAEENKNAEVAAFQMEGEIVQEQAMEQDQAKEQEQENEQELEIDQERQIVKEEALKQDYNTTVYKAKQ